MKFSTPQTDQLLPDRSILYSIKLQTFQLSYDPQFLIYSQQCEPRHCRLNTINGVCPNSAMTPRHTDEQGNTAGNVRGQHIASRNPSYCDPYSDYWSHPHGLSPIVT